MDKNSVQLLEPMWGNYWKTTLINDFSEIELDPITNYCIAKFLDTLDSYHSVYIRGSFLERNLLSSWVGSINTSQHSDIDFIVVMNDKEEIRKSPYSRKHNVHINRIPVDVKLLTEERFRRYPKDLFLAIFPVKCIAGEDLSKRIIDLHDVKHDYYDKSKTLHNQLANPKCYNQVRDRRTAKKYIKRLLRDCFDTVGPRLGLHTRSVDYCQYFFAKENPKYAKLTSHLLDMFLNTNRYDWSHIQKVISDSEILIDFIEDYGKRV